MLKLLLRFSNTEIAEKTVRHVVMHNLYGCFNGFSLRAILAITATLIFISSFSIAQEKPIPPPVPEKGTVISADESSYAFPGIYNNLYQNNPLPVKNQVRGDTIAFTTYDYFTNYILHEQIGWYGRNAVFSPMIKKPGALRMVDFITSTGGVYTRNSIFDSTAGSTGFPHLAVKQSGFYPGTYTVAAHQVREEGQPNTGFAISADNNPFYTKYADFGWYPAIAWSGDNLFGLARDTEGFTRFKSTDFGQTFIDMGRLVDAFPDSILRPNGYYVRSSVTASQNGKHIVYYGTSLNFTASGFGYAYLGVHPDSCSTVWTLHSSDYGSTWIYNTILIDGTPNIVQDRPNYAPRVNELSQIDLTVTNQGVMHVVANGYGVRFQTGTLNTNGNLFPLLYWNSTEKTWLAVSDIAVDTIQQIGSTYPGRAIGSAHPSIAIDEDWKWLYIFYTGPQRSPLGKLDIVDGLYRTDIYMINKENWGFSPPLLFAGKPDASESFAHTLPRSVKGENRSHCKTIPVLYLEDHIPGVSILDGTPAGYEPLIYKIYGFGFDCDILDAEETESRMQFSLEQNYPNPFNPVTEISYTIPHNGKVSLVVYDALGREAAVLVNKDQDAGIYTVSFDGKHLASGIYYYKISTGNFVETKKMILLK